MKEFGAIDQATEADAMKTIFFVDGEFDGKPYRVCATNYLALLSMRGPEIQGEVQKIKGILAQYPTDLIEQDVVRLLQARNWRVHNIACVVLACGFTTEKALAALWDCIRIGSWASPQLTSTAAFIDPTFRNKAIELVGDKTTYYKSIVPLAGLLKEVHHTTFSFWNKRYFLIRQAKKLDRDRSDAIASGWLESLRNALA